MVRRDTCNIALAAIAMVAIAIAGCGGHDRITVAEAKEKLAADCEEGHFGNRARCRCLAGELQARGRSGPQIDAVRKAIDLGTPGAEVRQAFAACDARL